MIISIDVERVPGKTEHPFMINTQKNEKRETSST